MLGKRGAQRGLLEADTLYGDFVGKTTFYGFLATQRDELFGDEAFAGLYNEKLGRPSVAPSVLATALVLQSYDGVSDDEARRRATYDLQWKVALGIPVDSQPFAKSTLQSSGPGWWSTRNRGRSFRRAWSWPSSEGISPAAAS